MIGDNDPQVRLRKARALYRLQGDDAITLIGQIYCSQCSASIRKDIAALVAASLHPLAGRFRHLIFYQSKKKVAALLSDNFTQSHM